LLRQLFRRLQALTWLPEFNVALFAFLVHFPWEILQARLFVGMASAPHWDAVRVCTFAAFGDALITLLAYWAAAARSGRHWLEKPALRPVAWFMTVGLGTTVVIEQLATHGGWFTSWAYGQDMPVIPVVEVGLVPVLQWLVLPPIVLALVARQLRGRQL
jgi:hypothetical protein